MTVTFNKSLPLGEVKAPPSKSETHRALICSFLAGKGKVDNIAYSNDINATLSCLEALGADIKKEDSFVVFGGKHKKAERVLDCFESGSTLRFLIPISLISENTTVFKGSTRLFERDLSLYYEIFKKQGIKYNLTKDSLTLSGKLHPDNFSVRGDISSQFISGLLFALPLLDGDSTVTLKNKLESRPYVDITLYYLKKFGIDIKYSDNVFYIKGNQKCKQCDLSVSGDYSNAVFFEALNLFSGKVKVTGLNPDTLQGDSVYFKIFEELKNGKREFDISDCPDLAPVLFAVSSLFKDVTFFGTSRLKIKESDRASSMAEELKKFGILLSVSENSVRVVTDKIKPPYEILNSHNDHRVVMALSVLCTFYGGKIEGAEAVNKSFCNFFRELKSLNVKVTKE